jgi:hypothetical protein
MVKTFAKMRIWRVQFGLAWGGKQGRPGPGLAQADFRFSNPLL